MSDLRVAHGDERLCRPVLGEDFVWRCEACGEFIDAAVIFPGDGAAIVLPVCVEGD
jgi:hypothetical protein